MDMRMFQKMMADVKKSKQLIEQRMAEVKVTEFSSSVGRDMFKLTMNGAFEVLKCEIDDRIVGDKDTLQDLIIASVTEVVAKINKELKKIEEDLIPKNFG